MFYNTGMKDALSRLQTLSAQMSLEPAEECSAAHPSPDFGSPTGVLPPTGTMREGAGACPESFLRQDELRRRGEGIFVHPAVLPNGQRIKLFKTLLTSVCERDCYYCPFRAGRDFRRATFQPEEFARLFVQLYERGIAEGIFISSGMAGGGMRTQDRLIETIEILRFKLGFRGYVHLKIMPGAERAQVERAMQIADRVSVNLEAPNSGRLTQLAPHKQFTEELLAPLKWVDEIRRTQSPAHTWNGRWPSTVTQFVTGAVGESDLELLTTTAYLYRHLKLKRAYYSRFTPIPDTPLENQPPTPAIRELRLYQASFLLRDYGFDLEEMPFEADGCLPVQIDPKQAWAQINLSGRPLEVNRAERRELLRVPGIGPKSAEAILRARRQGKLRDPSALRSLGIVVARAAPFLLFDGKRAACQPELF
ncbi:MAG: putative DNA modification/repair radical SAM protein [Anaerolineales bacterium]|nr:putative DNA modification/repair radical SAM protein [Anaerolineales bacterium]